MSQTSEFVKQLASNQRPVREKALASLKKYLVSKSSSKLSLLDMEKLWKGLYYSMWFCDRPKTQERLAEDLGSLFSQDITSLQFIKFTKSFWIIMIKEWPSIDQWRIDKYYLLIRRVLRHNFQYLLNNSWNNQLIDDFISCLDETVLSGDKSIPMALPYHLCDIYLDELELIMFTELKDQQEELDNELDHESPEYLEKLTQLSQSKQNIVKDVPVTKLISSFARLNESALLKTLREKCKEDVLDDERLIQWGIKTAKEVENDSEDDSGSESEEEWQGL